MRTHSPDERLRRASSFDEDAERYDRARPTYPAELFSRLWQLAQLGDSPDVAEIGCGTGQASLSLAERGARLICVELGANMAAVARRNLASYPSARVVVSKFEDWDAGGETVDLVFAAASWHWIQPDARYEKAASTLRSGGHMAVVHSEHVYPEGFDPLYLSIQDVYGEVTGSRKHVAVQEMPKFGELDSLDLEHIAEMERTGGFQPPIVERFLWHFDRTADGYVDLLGTYSDHWALEPDKRARLFEGIHRVIAESPTGSIRKHYLTSLRLARRR